MTRTTARLHISAAKKPGQRPRGHKSLQAPKGKYIKSENKHQLEKRKEATYIPNSPGQPPNR